MDPQRKSDKRGESNGREKQESKRPVSIQDTRQEKELRTRGDGRLSAKQGPAHCASSFRSYSPDSLSLANSPDVYCTVSHSLFLTRFFASTRMRIYAKRRVYICTRVCTVPTRLISGLRILRWWSLSYLVVPAVPVRKNGPQHFLWLLLVG